MTDFPDSGQPDSADDTAGSWYPAWQLVEHPNMEIEIGELATLPVTRAGQTFVEVRRLLSLESVMLAIFLDCPPSPASAVYLSLPKQNESLGRTCALEG